MTAQNYCFANSTDGYGSKKEAESQSSGELKELIDSEKIKLLSPILLSRYKGLNTLIPKSVVLRHLDAIVIDTDIIRHYRRMY